MITWWALRPTPMPYEMSITTANVTAMAFTGRSSDQSARLRSRMEPPSTTASATAAPTATRTCSLVDGLRPARSCRCSSG